MPSRIILPPVPAQFASDGVAAWDEALEIDSYLPEEPSAYPAFLDSRVYQGSSGKVFPLPFHERISQRSEPHLWRAIHLENEWVRLVILPELGGRIHIGYDKVADYDFFYRNNVIKPALVGLAGPWVSGGVEFNWPQHHRPGTFLPTDVEIERESDGAITVWCSDHDPFTRMKGMHGIRLRLDSAVIEARVRLYNRSDETQTFLWWANVAAAVNDDYQSFFPTDVHYVADHAKRAVASFPRVDGTYYGVDYAARVTPAQPDADRIDWYRNIPVPTSYMVTATEDNFFGGYDHARQAGFVHWAERGVVPGKKQWTWGNSEFGWAWDRNLTDDDGPYIELMAGAYTDNQPDFSYLTPGETKTFSQFWYPIQRIGTVQQASLDAALHFSATPSGDGVELELGLAVSRGLDDVSVEVATETGTIVATWRADVVPGAPLVEHARVVGIDPVAPLVVSVRSAGAEVLHWIDRRQAPGEPPRLSTEPADPHEIASSDELFYTGQYLEQYRHATRDPLPYWDEAMHRDRADVRANIAVGARLDRAALFAPAESHFRAALSRLLERVPNPADGEAHYRLGLNLVHQGRHDEAIAPLVKATWNSGWLVPASFALGRTFSRAGQPARAESALRTVLEHEVAHLQATCLLAVLLRARGATDEADALLLAQHGRDPLDQWTRDLLGLPITTDAPTLLDVAIEYAASGFVRDALRLLDATIAAAATTPVGQVGVATIALYHRAQLVAPAEVADALALAAASDFRHCLPSRLADVAALEFALEVNPADATAATLLASWHYDKGSYELAIDLWSRAVASRPHDLLAAIAHRNLGIALYNVRRDEAAALAEFEAACQKQPDDAKLLYEFDQLRGRTGVSVDDRFALLEQNAGLVTARDDLTIAYVNLLVDRGDAVRAEATLRSRQFQPWEGGEGEVLAAWDATKIALCQTALAHADGTTARQHLAQAITYPDSLGEGRHPLANRARLYWLVGISEQALGNDDQARDAWETAAGYAGDFVGMATHEFSDQTYWSIRALDRLGRLEEAESLTARLDAYARELEETPARIDFFATSLPALLIFHDDPERSRQAFAARLLAQVASLRARPSLVE
jgi:tetratricopeptide (TPR) repeat protein